MVVLYINKNSNFICKITCESSYVAPTVHKAAPLINYGRSRNALFDQIDPRPQLPSPYVGPMASLDTL